MARKSPAAPAPEPAKAKRKPRAKATRRPPAQKALGTPQFVMPPGASYADMSRMANMLTPEQAIELYKANARMALDVINAAIESTAKLRRLQYQGEEQARELHRKAAKSASEAKDPHSLMAVGQGAAQEALEKSMHYWGEMFDLITEIQKRVFTLIEDQASGMPGVKQAQALLDEMLEINKPYLPQFWR